LLRHASASRSALICHLWRWEAITEQALRPDLPRIEATSHMAHSIRLSPFSILVLALDCIRDSLELVQLRRDDLLRFLENFDEVTNEAELFLGEE